jgi:hypothetical protein
LGSIRRARLAAEENRRRGRGGAHRHEEGIGTKERWRGLTKSSELKKSGGGRADLWRAILSIWWHFGEEKQKEDVAEREGFYRGPRLGGGGRVSGQYGDRRLGGESCWRRAPAQGRRRS